MKRPPQFNDLSIKRVRDDDKLVTRSGHSILGLLRSVLVGGQRGLHDIGHRISLCPPCRCQFSAGCARFSNPLVHSLRVGLNGR